ncbi:MAG: GspE/PulE family protein [Nitrospiria bacterium]
MPKSFQNRKRLGEMLISEGLLSEAQLERTLAEQREHGGRIGMLLKDLGFVTEDDIIKALGRQMGIAYVDLSSTIIDPEVIKTVPEILARRHSVIPLHKKENKLTLAMADPLNVFAIDDVKRVSGCEVEPVVGKEADMLRAIDRYYGMTGTMEEVVRSFEEQRESPDRRQGSGERRRGDRRAAPSPYDPASGLGDGESAEAENLETVADDAPVVKLVNTAIMQAVREGASDIHIEPDADVLRIRFRIDGILREITTAPKELEKGVISRIKIMASLDISEKRVPQDGRIEMKVGGKEFDLRLSTLPTVHGEKAVMRLLDKSSVMLGLDDLGFAEETLKSIRKVINRPYGMMLVTGPTGSGKTTTLYSALTELNAVEKNIVTIEDPVEYQIKRISQVPVNMKSGVTFPSGLRSILRQDPDIVMVGEVRDRETAVIAIQAALTGHFVLSTLHTNDSAGAIARLIDIGVEPFLIASSLVGIVSQRLLRKICKHCKESYPAPSRLVTEMKLNAYVRGENGVRLFRGKGCGECRGIGYSGRIGIYELLIADDAIRGLIISRAPSTEIRKQASTQKFRSLQVEGIRKAIQGITTIEEVLRVTQEFD